MIKMIGKKFGKLTVISRSVNNRWRGLRWVCLCDCGKETITNGCDIRSGHTKSCGCLSVKHGQKKNGTTSKIYAVWYHMIDRCTNVKSKYYNDYGGRGISVCQRWMKFENFSEDMGEVPQGCQIDRIDNNQGYDKENCKWVTPKQQQRNKRSNHLATHNGKTQCLAAWSEEVGINYDTLLSRINRNGWTIEKALTTPVRNKMVVIQ